MQNYIFKQFESNLGGGQSIPSKSNHFGAILATTFGYDIKIVLFVFQDIGINFCEYL